MEEQISVIARIRCDFPTKFGIPRQSGLAKDLRAMIVFEPDYRSPEALRGIEGFSHLWLIWQFSQVPAGHWSATVRPPRLGGNRRLGVFATRSPFRPNRLGLSCVKLEEIRSEPELGTVLIVSGADLMDGTPIFDIKPYLPYADAVPEAVGGFAPEAPDLLALDFPPHLLARVPAQKREALCQVLRLDPRPPYQNDPQRIYGMEYADYEIHFRVIDQMLVVLDLKQIPCSQKETDSN